MQLQGNTFQIRRAKISDAVLLSEISGALFRQTYQGSMAPDDLDNYINQSLNAKTKGSELKDPRINTVLVEWNNAIVGYAQIRKKGVPLDCNAQNSVELWRIYLDNRYHGHGIGYRLFKHVVATAKDMAANHIWLGVWDQNLKAIQFYKELGFNIVGSQQFDVGSEIQNDLVMVASILDV